MQIVGEMLPISSSGHLHLLQKYAESRHISLEQFVYPLPLKTFYYFLHGFTLIVLSIFLLHYFLNQKISWRYIKNTIQTIFIADSITVIFYILIHYFSLEIPLSLGFFITVFLLLSLYKVPHGSSAEISLSQAAIIGTVQGISLLPGISRLASTFTGARWLGIKPMTAFIFSWLIQVPLIVLAFSDSLFRITKSGSWHYLLNLPVALVIVISSIIAGMALAIMVKLIDHDRVALFGWYMILPLAISLFI